MEGVERIEEIEAVEDDGEAIFLLAKTSATFTAYKTSNPLQT